MRFRSTVVSSIDIICLSLLQKSIFYLVFCLLFFGLYNGVNQFAVVGITNQRPNEQNAPFDYVRKQHRLYLLSGRLFTVHVALQYDINVYECWNVNTVLTNSSFQLKKKSVEIDFCLTESISFPKDVFISFSKHLAICFVEFQH